MIVQRAVVTILERIYEVDFCDTSYGFRPGRSCHGALAALGQTIATKKVNWISDADIRGFFDHVNHEQLLELLGQRIGDPRMLWLVQRFLTAGVMIAGHREDTDQGVPQGSVLSPRFSLELAEEKTKLLRFGRFAERDASRFGEGAPGTFDFLGFTHYCGHSRAGKFKLKRKTAKKKFR
jgi:RNA-directed DNA polymerase